MLPQNELATLQLISQGKTNKEIALELGVSVRTITTYVQKAGQKLEAQSRTEAVLRAIELGIITKEPA